MHRINYLVIARVLIVISMILLSCGFILDYYDSHKLIDPIKDVETSNDNNDISIISIDNNSEETDNTEDNTDSVNINTYTNTTNNNSTNVNSTTNNSDNKTKNTTNNNSNSSNNTNTNSNTTNIENNNVVNNNQYVPTIDDINNELRNNIQNSYGITVRYGNETYGYIVDGITTNPITDPNVVNSQLTQLQSALSLYPRGFFQEIRDGGIPLTVYLINSYARKNVTGITDSSYSYANISIAAIYPFNDSFFHESYHYIERYMFKTGKANFNSWNMFNPADFTYGVIVNDYAYSVTFSPDAYFVNTYAESGDDEDRASTFEYMMASSKANCLNNGTVIYQKAKYMADTMEAILNTVRPENVDYWERFL